MAYNHKLYLNNCRMMIEKNKRQLEDTLNRKERQEGNLEDLEMEIEGWQMWVDTWTNRLNEALKTHKK